MKNSSDPTLLATILSGIQQWTQCPLSQKHQSLTAGDIKSLPVILHKAFKDQIMIGWVSFLIGHLSKYW
jgi:hypothetical protein